jgi:hypothetical protein
MRLASTELQTQDPWIIEEKYPFDFDVLFRVHYQAQDGAGSAEPGEADAGKQGSGVAILSGFRRRAQRYDRRQS